MTRQQIVCAAVYRELEVRDGFIKIRRVGLERLLARRREVRCLEHFSAQMKPGPRSE